MTSILQKILASRGRTLLILAALTALVYLPSLSGDFVWDDHLLIEERKDIFKAPDGLSPLLSNHFWWQVSGQTGMNDLYRPWITFTYWLDFQLYDVVPFGYHLSNYIVHIANVLLVFLLFVPIFGNLYAFFIAALFGVCPAALTSASWISGRTDLWVTFFVLIFLIAFRLSRDKILYLIPALLSLFMAFLSKELAIVAPIFAIVLQYFESNNQSKVSVSKTPLWYYLVLFIPIAAYFGIRSNVLGTVASPTISKLSLSQTIPLMAEQYLRSAFNILVPFRYNYTSEISWSIAGARGPLFSAMWMLFILFVGVTVYGAFKKKWWSAGALWFGIALFPAYTLHQTTTVVADIYSYLAIPGLIIFAVKGIPALAGTLSSKSTDENSNSLMMASIVIVFALLTFIRIPLIKTDETLFTYLMERDPKSSSSAGTLAETYRTKGDTEKAVFWLNKALDANPQDWRLHNNIALIYLNKNDIQSAAPHVDALAELAPNDMIAQTTIAKFYYVADHCKEAGLTYQNAFSLGPPTPEMLFDYSLTLICLQLDSAAIQVLDAAIAEKPFWPEAYHNRGICYENIGQYQLALESYQSALKQNPNFEASRESIKILIAQKAN